MYSDRVCEVCSFNSEHTSLTSRNPHTDKNNAIEWCVKIGFRILGVRQQARNQIRSERNRRNQQTSEVFETSEVLVVRQHRYFLGCASVCRSPLSLVFDVRCEVRKARDDVFKSGFVESIQITKLNRANRGRARSLMQEGHFSKERAFR